MKNSPYYYLCLDRKELDKYSILVMSGINQIMSWTQQEVRDALAELSPAPDNDVDAATALNQQTTTLPPQDVLCSDVREVILLTGEWVAIKATASMPVSSFTAPTTQDQVIIAAATCVAALDPASNVQFLRVSSDDAWNKVQMMLGALHLAGLVSDTSMATLVGLRTPTVPKWDPPIGALDIATIKSSA